MSSKRSKPGRATKKSHSIQELSDSSDQDPTTNSSIKQNALTSNSTASHSGSSDSDSPRAHKKAKKITKRGVNFGISDDESDIDFEEDPTRAAQKKSLAEHAKRRLSGKFGARRSVNGLNRSVSINNNLDHAATPQKSLNNSVNRASPSVESNGPTGGGARVGALARVRENQARNANRGSGGLQGIGGENRLVISTEVMNNNYDEWMKMATDNKINVNNTWSFALIDYFHDMSLLRNPEAQGGINFQKASCTLDGCVKIWTSRVDSVATETGKLLSGLAEEANNLANNIDGNSTDEEMGEDTATKVKKPRTRTANANSTSLVDFNDKIKVKDLELEFTVDPLFKKTCADFDEGGPGGILMSHLAIDSTMTIVFDASGKSLTDLPDDDKDDAVQEEDEQPMIDVSKLKYLAALAETAEEPPPNDQPGGGGGGDFFDSGYDPNSADMDFAMGDGVGDDDDDEGGVGMMSTFNANKMPNERDMLMALVDDPTSTSRIGQSTMANESSGMFDYFDKSLKKMWAGPEHWKLRRTVSKARDEEGQSTMTRTKREKTAFSFDFTQPLTTPRKTIFQTSTVPLTLPGYKPPKPKSHQKIIKKISGSKSLAGSKQMMEQHCLPDDMHFNASQLLRFDMKPKATFTMRVKSGANQQNSSNTEIDENYWAQTAAAAAAQSTLADQTEEGTNEDIPFATQFFQDEGDDTPDFEEEFDNPVGALPTTPSIETTIEVKEVEEEDLIAATQNLNTRVRPEFISYAKKAKRVDVKKLKENIWRELEELTNELEAQKLDDQPESERNPTEPPNSSNTEKSKTFTKVIGGLQKLYPKEKMEEISTSFCFICLLHLANEKGLSIQSKQSSLKDKDKRSNDDDDDDDDGLEVRKFVGGLTELKVIREE
ncbi:uncharacterized protein MELLADRAFT_62786 [Melampsora larici-populina 98AG31]|uniref:Condensin complex subunit 2 n=1 Tax=Melampsora larici-populina (strain 98AG31 / pathotype 3-4-7) TaxID=747676 RepID=F4RK86_MELLP|nr:uncharacterized protein MELLADRAFT_62786 [Melampsora larici-populina 98AG31]EGG07226.1 hypothetical protein MELLADRAFT_62786 [Melampsora larici-populina 98AG31]